MYTWGYIKENTLNKLNLTESEANEHGFLRQFPYYANEAITQICSAIKPKESYYEITIADWQVGSVNVMPSNFVAFSDSPIYWAPASSEPFKEISNEFLEFVGYASIRFKAAGIYRIPYDARWQFFDSNTSDGDLLQMPADICDALPSYIASQCYKLDDELKAATYRNEYEMFLARINDTSSRRQKDFFVGGGW